MVRLVPMGCERSPGGSVGAHAPNSIGLKAWREPMRCRGIGRLHAYFSHESSNLIPSGIVAPAIGSRSIMLATGTAQ